VVIGYCLGSVAEQQWNTLPKSQPMNEILSEAFASHAKDLLEKWHVPGLSIAVFNKQSTHTAAFGHARFEPPVPATPDTIYDMASTSKSFTAAAIGKLVADNDLQSDVAWTAKMSDLLPDDFVLPDVYATKHATIEDILSHRTGMPGHDLSYMSVRAAQPDTPQSVTRSLRHLPMNQSLRTAYQYNNMMYTVATHLIETLTRQYFSSFLHETFFGPLGMSSTYLQPSAVPKDRSQLLAHRHVWKPTTQTYLTLPHPVEQPEGQGAGSIQSTIADFARWGQALLTRITDILPEKIYDDLFTPRIILDAESTVEEREPFTGYELYCLGLSVRSYRGHRIVEHDGSITGVQSLLCFLPEDDFGLVVCGNGDNAAVIAHILAMELFDNVLGVTEAEGVDWARRAVEVTERAAKEEAEKGAELARDVEGGYDATTRPLNAFTGTFTHPGYQTITIDIVSTSRKSPDGGEQKQEKLHVNALNRSEPFELFFEGLRDVRVDEEAGKWEVEKESAVVCTADIVDDGGDVLTVWAVFDFRERRIGDGKEERAQRVGIALCAAEEEMLIWFDRV
jgi:CubicO group peptidase (beta-lactamase class C family)